MINEKSTEKKKTRGELSAKIIWIIGALFFGIYALSSFLSIGSEAESAADCLKSGIGHTLYFLAFTIGNLYLFRRKKEKTSFIGAAVYTAAYAFSLICQLTGGGQLSTEDLTTQILSLIAYIVFAAFIWILAGEQQTGMETGMKAGVETGMETGMKAGVETGMESGMASGTESGMYTRCLKYWYLPAALLLLVGMIGNLWVELVRPDGFLWDGFIVDTILTLIMTLPVFTMSRVVKERI